jgi:hypothetical protein
MKGLERFVESRMQGRLLSKTVLLNIGMDAGVWWKWRDLFVFPAGRTDSPRDDFRPLVGLDVILVAETYTDTVAAIYTRIKDYAASIVFVILSAEDGLVWAKGGEDREL